MLSIVLHIFAIIAAILLTIIYFVEKRELKKKLSHFPGPKSYPIIGCAHLLLGDVKNILYHLMKIFSSYPSPFKLFLGPRVFVGISDPEQIKIILMSQKALEKDEFYQFSKPWIGAGLLIAPVSIWRVHRKLIQPAFNLKVLESFVQGFQKHANLLTKEMSKEVGGEEFRTLPYLSSCSLNIICETAMGVSVFAEEEKRKGYLNASERVFKAIGKRAVSIWLHPEMIFKLTKTSKIFYEGIEYLHNITNYVIKKRRSDLKNGLSPNAFVGQQKPFLHLLMELSDNGKGLSDTEIREEVDTMMFGGHDTTASINSFVLLMLALHPDIQDKAYEEIYNLYGSEDPEDNPVEHKDLHKLEYLERVIKETLRLFPVTPILLRHVTDDLNIGEYTIPKGCSVALPIFNVHRDEKYWSDPLIFNPDRFLPEEVDKRHPFTFIPFSAGPRNCIGLVFAMMSMKVVLATILRKYVIKTDNIIPVKDVRLKINILLKPVKPLTIKIEKRVQ